MRFSDTLAQMLETSIATKQTLLYIAGNGGSAADAQHLAAELVCRLSQDRNPLPAEALTVDSSILTAIGNDYGYEDIFSRQLAGKATEHDVFLAISTSGNSPNILRALQHAKAQKLPSILFSGGNGGQAQTLADVSVIVPSSITAAIQETHLVLVHALCSSIETSMFDLE
jgi:D-sedoheptulose 7-phosphate isomerase